MRKTYELANLPNMGKIYELDQLAEYEKIIRKKNLPNRVKDGTQIIKRIEFMRKEKYLTKAST